MIYEYECITCGERIDIRRTVTEYRKGPDGLEMDHPGCDGTEFRRVISPLPSSRSFHRSTYEEPRRFWRSDSTRVCCPSGKMPPGSSYWSGAWE